ncbi:MAG: type-F conjugative transfer system pilin assembly protein TrbC [Desulfuromonadaceae bacterium]
MRRLRAQLIVFLLLTNLPAFAAGKAGYIATPDACYVPETVEGESVYLKKAGVCGGQPGRAFVQTERQTVKFFVDGKFWKENRVEEMSVPDVAATLAQADRLADTLKMPKNRHEDEMKAVAGTLDAYYRSDEFQGRVRSETERIKSQVFGESFARFYPDNVARERNGKLIESERVYIFVSSSMPLQTVRNYAASVARLGDPRIVMVMRGFIGGMTKIQPSIHFVADALKKDALCSPAESECGMHPANLVVDPLLYRRYAIERVPAVVFAKGVKAENPGLSEGDIKNTDVTDSYTVYGDASLEYILQVIGRESGTSSLKELLAPAH